MEINSPAFFFVCVKFPALQTQLVPGIHRKQLILDFLNEVVQKPTVLIGNSVGSLACVIAASGMFDSSPS